MPRKRENAEGGGQPNKRQKCDQASGLPPKSDSVPQKKATRSTPAKKDNAGGAQIMKPIPPPKLQLRHIPPLTEPYGFPCFSDGDVLVVLHSGNTRHHCRLHSHILRNFGPIFRDLLSTKADENIPKKMLGPNPTSLEFCLELSRDPASDWGLQRGSLFGNVTLDNSKAIPAAEGQTKGHGRGFGCDGSADDTPIPPTDKGSALSPPRTPDTHSNWKYDPQGSHHATFSDPLKAPEKLAPAEHPGYSSTQDPGVDMFSGAEASGESGPVEHLEPFPTQDLKIDTPSSPAASEEPALVKFFGCAQAQEGEELSLFGHTVNNGTVEAFGKDCDSAPVNDYQTQGSIQTDFNIFDSSQTAAPTEVTIETPSRIEANVLGNEALITPTHESEASMVEMRQFTKPKQIGNGLSLGIEGFPKEDAYDSTPSSRTATLDIKTPSTPTSDWGTSPVTPMTENEGINLGGSKMENPLNTPNARTLVPGSAEIFIPILNFHEVNSATRTGDKGKKTSLARVNIGRVLVDDDCQIISVKPKSQSPSTTPVIPIAECRPALNRKIEALFSLLRVAYYRVPIISKKDINLALIQSENLIEAANFYQVLPAVRAHVSYSLAQHGHSLFQSVALEPVRWLNISIGLEDKIVFQEAMIHLVGAFPDKFTLDSFPGVPRAVIDLVQRKATEIICEASRVNELLILSSVYELGISASLTDKSAFDVWILASLWREWLARNVKEAKTQRRHPDEPNIQSKLGMLYRTLSAGGDTYLSKDEVMAILLPFRQQNGASQIEGFLQWDTAECDLAQIKTYASKTVQSLCYNRSQLDPSEAGFNYLTCTHIGNHEFPWVSAPRN